MFHCKHCHGSLKGISLTEFYDVLELENKKKLNLQKMVSDLMTDWEPMSHHRLIINRIKQLNAPLLTTNYEKTFARCFDYKQLRAEKEGFTDYYPWSTYHGKEELKMPTDGFAVWYINGMINYPRSIKLGLSHYMGSVERARNLIQKGNDALYAAKNTQTWKGCKTWLHTVFNKSLFVFGLGLDENETFLRWLFLERMKYFNKFPERKHKGWYINKKSDCETDEGKKFFLEKIGFEVIDVNDYADIYENIWK